MPTFTKQLQLSAPGKSTKEFTSAIEAGLHESGLREGTVTVFCCHTSCSLVIMENADPSARRDLERFIDRLVPEDDPDFTHTYEGPDDMPTLRWRSLAPLKSFRSSTVASASARGRASSSGSTARGRTVAASC